MRLIDIEKIKQNLNKKIEEKPDTPIKKNNDDSENDNSFSLGLLPRKLQQNFECLTARSDIKFSKKTSLDDPLRKNNNNLGNRQMESSVTSIKKMKSKN